MKNDPKRNTYLTPGVNAIVDGQYGSTGKGLLTGWLGVREHVDIAICSFAPNAGHTYIAADGRKFVALCLPFTGVFNDDAMILLSAGALIDPEKLIHEIEEFKIPYERVMVHPSAGIITADHRNAEANPETGAHKVSSTGKGVGASMQAKIGRHPDYITAANCSLLRDLNLVPSRKDYERQLARVMEPGVITALELAQGFDLSLNHGFYPYVTSRNVDVAQGMSDAMLSPFALRQVFMTARTYPIRVGNNYDQTGQQTGWSGPCYTDQQELTWEEVTKRAGAPHSLLERTTVTQKVRRIFTWSDQQFERSLFALQPTHIFVNFVNYLYWQASNWTSQADVTDSIFEWLSIRNRLALPHDGRIAWIGVGANDAQVLPVRL